MWVVGDEKRMVDVVEKNGKMMGVGWFDGSEREREWAERQTKSKNQPLPPNKLS